MTTDAGGQVQTAVTTNTSLNSQYPGGALDQLQVELLVGDNSTAVTLVSQSYFARNARHYYDALNDSNAFDALANSMHQAARYGDQSYVTEKILDLGSNLSNPAVNTLQAVFGSLSALPEAYALSPYLDDIRLFFAQTTNTILLQSVNSLINDAVKRAIKYGDTEPVDKLVVSLLVHAEMLQSAPAAAQAIETSVKSRADFETWVNILSLPAVGWIGGTPPIPALETNCPTNAGIWINAGSPLAVPLVPCRLTASMAGDIITGFMLHVNMQAEPEILSHSLADFYKELTYANVSFRKLILDPAYQRVAATNNGLFIKDAHALLPIVTRMGSLFVKAGKKGIKNFKALLTNKTNARVNSVVLFGTIAYLLNRLDADCPVGSGPCEELGSNADEKEKIRSEIENNIFKIMTNVIVRAKLTGQTAKKDGELSCKFTGNTHGAIFELLMTAYFHAKHEGLLGSANPESRIVELERSRKISIAAGKNKIKALGGLSEDASLYTFTRRSDIVLAGDGTDIGVKLIELKSLQAHPAKDRVTNASAKVRGKFPKWSKKTSGSTYHRQFLLDRIAAYDEVIVDKESQQRASDFEWYFQSWKVPKKISRDTDPGVSVTDAKCGSGKGCLSIVREKLTDEPDHKDTLIKYNWPDIDDLDNLKDYGSKIKKFDIGTILGDSLFTDFPPEVNDLMKELDSAEAKIDSLEEQAAELQKQADEILGKIDDAFKKLPGYDDLKRKAKKLAENAEEVLDDIDQRITEVVDQIPDTLVCDE